MAVMKRSIEALDLFGIAHEIMVTSAHRNPEATVLLAKSLEQRGIRVVIAGAGGAAHLPGVIAAYTNIPVIGVPLASSPLGGFDSLYSMVQMPAGVPVATMAVGGWGAFNAGVFAAQIIGIHDDAVRDRLLTYRGTMRNRGGLMRKLRITARGHEWSALLNHSETADKLWTLLPATGKANRWGDEVYFPVAIDKISGSWQEVVAEGDIGLCPPDALCLFFGPTPMSKGTEIRPASPVVVVGRITGDLALLKDVLDGDEVIVEQVK
jgi:5-(carboxyamino)imidazole ribonucleotide mutase